MAFKATPRAAEMTAALNDWQVTILGENGLRLTGPTSFHLDEGPDFAWLNIYRALADGCELAVVRGELGTTACIDDDVVVSWPANEKVDAELSARYHVDEASSTVDVTFSATANKDFTAFELFIANYFTPYFSPSFAINDGRAHPEGDVVWYTTEWNSALNDECWPRDAGVRPVFTDGRWADGYPLNWKFGPDYSLPLMIQQHRYAGMSIFLMARPEDCIGLSGYNSYHNSQYFHLFGFDLAAGATASTTVRMVVAASGDDVKAQAVVAYKDWTA